MLVLPICMLQLEKENIKDQNPGTFNNPWEIHLLAYHFYEFLEDA